MADTSEPASPLLATTPDPAPHIVPRSKFARLLLAPARFVWRRPWRALGLLTLVVLFLGAAGAAGLLLWTGHHLAAARREVGLAHNWSAIRHLHSCRLLQPNRPEVLLLCARVARRSGSWTEAEELLDRYWRKRGDDDDLVLERLLLKATRGETEKVWGLLQTYIDKGNAAAALAREALATGLLYRFRLDEVEKFLRRWQEIEPDSTLALNAWGKLCELRENNSGALLAYRQILDRDAEHDEIRFRVTRLLLQFRQGEEALAQAEYLRRRLPDSADVMVQLARALDLQGRTDEARALLDECLAGTPDHAGALVERGQHARREGDGARAEQLLSQAIRFEPGDLAARYQYYLALNQNEKKAEAVRELEAIRQMEADIRRINSLTQGQQQASPDNPAVCHEIAMISARAGRPQEMLRWLLNALQADPDHLPTHRALVGYYQEVGNPILAARHGAIARQLGGRPRP